MKKMILMVLLASSISLSGWAKESRNHLGKDKKTEEKLLAIKPTWDCWHFSIACINGWFCANDIGTAFAAAEAAAIRSCPCPVED